MDSQTAASGHLIDCPRLISVSRVQLGNLLEDFVVEIMIQYPEYAHLIEHQGHIQRLRHFCPKLAFIPLEMVEKLPWLDDINNSTS